MYTSFVARIGAKNSSVLVSDLSWWCSGQSRSSHESIHTTHTDPHGQTSWFSSPLPPTHSVHDMDDGLVAFFFEFAHGYVISEQEGKRGRVFLLGRPILEILLSISLPVQWKEKQLPNHTVPCQTQRIIAFSGQTPTNAFK